MTVSSKSWHYRLYNLATSLMHAMFAWPRSPLEVPGTLWELIRGRRQNVRPKNLCLYFRTVVGCAVAALILLPLEALLVAIVFVICVVIAYVGMPIHDKYEERQYRKYGPEGKPQKEPGLLRTFVAAKKKKACPMITVDFGP